MRCEKIRSSLKVTISLDMDYFARVPFTLRKRMTSFEFASCRLPPRHDRACNNDMGIVSCVAVGIDPVKGTTEMATASGECKRWRFATMLDSLSRRIWASGITTLSEFPELEVRGHPDMYWPGGFSVLREPKARLAWPRSCLQKALGDVGSMHVVVIVGGVRHSPAKVRNTGRE
jgi:hypothetical protein